ncbi:MAG: phosphodiester glycosidase family protein [Bacteroidetes bacterium]|nr:phosphodiester glycosidase family protein [Bacteroidota bacterium]
MKKLFYKCIILFLFLTIEIFAADTLVVKTISSGCKYFQLKDTLVNVVIDLLEVDLRSGNVGLAMGISHDVLNKGGETVLDFVRRKREEGINIVAAVNGDFFGDDPMQSQNSMIRNGEIIKGVKLDRSSIAITSDKRPFIGKFPFEGTAIINEDTLSIDAINSQDSTLSLAIFTSHWKGLFPLTSTGDNIIIEMQTSLIPELHYNCTDYRRVTSNSDIELSENQILLKSKRKIDLSEIEDTLEFVFKFKNAPSEIFTLIGGLPMLFREEQLPESYYGAEGMTIKRFLDKNPRTAIGYDKEKTKLFIAVIDGRQPNYSMGMSLVELAEFMHAMGCYDALNFDGGGSTTMTIMDELINSPSDFTGSRPVYNYFFITSRE